MIKSKPQRIKLTDVAAEAKKVASKLSGGEIFALIGELGSGKTTFVKAVVKELDKKSKVLSPTFTVMNHARLKNKKYNSLPQTVYLYHLDLYRTSSWEELEQLGLPEVWGKPETITFIEWADKIKSKLPKKAHIIYFSHE